MKKTVLIALFLLVLNLSSYGQTCLPNGITFNTQASIDSFPINYPGCSQIGGFVTISGPDITNLHGLSSITAIGGDLSVLQNPLLVNLSGLDNLVSANPYIYLTIYYNASLESLSGLENLATVGALNISGNPSLLNMNGLHHFTSMNIVNINNNQMLEGLSGLEQITTLGTLDISNNAALTSLAGLENITSVDELWIHDNPLLTNLNGLENLHSVGDLRISYNAGLSNLHALGNLQSASGVSILDNPSLTNLDGLENLDSVAVGLTLSENEHLTSLEALSNISFVGLIIGIIYNNSLTSLSGLGNIHSINHLIIAGNPSLSNFNGLSNLESVGWLDIDYNSGIVNLSGLEHIKSIDHLEIIDNQSLKNLSGLENLNSLTAELIIQDNPTLSDCAIYPVCNHLLNLPTLVTISGNAPGCSTPAEVEAFCHTIPVLAEIRLDSNGNCQPDASDTPLADLQIRLEGGGQMLTQPANTQGRTQFSYLGNTPINLYLTQFPTENWDVCQSAITLDPASTTDTLRAIFLLKPRTQCPELNVRLGLPSFFYGCQTNSTLLIATENTGAITAQNVQTAVVIPPVIELVTAVPAPTAQHGDTLFFALGDLAQLTKSVVKLTVRTTCGTVLTGQTLCFETFSALDNACPQTLPAFSEVKATAECIGDSLIRFTLENIGDAPTQAVHHFKIIRNGLMLKDSTFDLAAHAHISFDLDADGATWRLEATKFDNGAETATAIEHCGGLTPGLITAFWLDHGKLGTDFDCRMVGDIYRDDKKTVMPSGSIIGPNKPLQYTIDFQNNSFITVSQVLVRDILQNDLDLNTFRPGFASHPYTWEIHGNTLEVLFAQIDLPSSLFDEPGSRGFFSFEINQKPDLPEGIYLQNRATMLFDSHTPMNTNLVSQMVGHLVLQVDELPEQARLWRILGNPTRDVAIFEATTFIVGEKKFELYNLSGKRVRNQEFSGQTFEFQRDMLSAGMYFFRITDAHGRAFTGKIILTE